MRGTKGLKLIWEHGSPYGIRDNSGFLFFFPPVRKYQGQDERYRQDLADRTDLADRLLAFLKSEYQDKEEK